MHPTSLLKDLMTKISLHGATGVHHYVFQDFGELFNSFLLPYIKSHDISHWPGQVSWFTIDKHSLKI